MESKQQSERVLSKDIRVNNPIGDDIIFDDFKLKGIHEKRFKVSEVRIAKDMKSEYISAIQMIYQSVDSSQTQVEGHLMGEKDSFNNPNLVSTVFKLRTDEYLISFQGRTGMIIDNFGITTSLGRTMNHGGGGGMYYQVQAPYKYHFINFTGYFSKKWKSICCFAADVSAIPQSPNENSPPPLPIIEGLFKRPVFRLISSYLSIRDVTRLFQTSKGLSEMRFDLFTAGQLSLRCLFSNDSSLLKYSNILTTHAGIFEDSEDWKNLFEKCVNIISNDDKMQVNQRDIKKERSNTLQFFAVRPLCTPTFTYEENISNFCSGEEINEIMKGELALCAGVQIASSGFNTNGVIQFTVTYEGENNNSQKKTIIRKSFSNIPKDLITYSLVYNEVSREKNTKELLMPLSFRFSVQVHEPSWWNCKICGFSVRKFPNNTIIEGQLIKNLALSIRGTNTIHENWEKSDNNAEHSLLMSESFN